MKVTIAFTTKLMRDWLVRKKASMKTLEAYEYALSVFEKFLLLYDIADLRAVGQSEIDQFIDFLLVYRRHGKGEYISNSTFNMVVGKVRKAFQILSRESYLFADPFRHFESFRRPVHLPRAVMTQEEIQQLFKQPDLDSYLGFRDRTIFEVLYGTGIRLGEMLGLDIYDIDFGENIIVIRHGKGGKDRLVPCTEIAMLFVKEYLEKVRPVLAFHDPEQKALFLTNKGNRLTNNAFVTMLKKYLVNSGIEKNITAHSFRHTFATQMLEGGANIRYIQEILGHELLSTTAVYTRVAVKNLKAMIKQFHPRENELYSDLS